MKTTTFINVKLPSGSRNFYRILNLNKRYVEDREPLLYWKFNLFNLSFMKKIDIGIDLCKIMVYMVYNENVEKYPTFVNTNEYLFSRSLFRFHSDKIVGGRIVNIHLFFIEFIFNSH